MRAAGRAFTLLEMLIVVALIAFLLGVGGLALHTITARKSVREVQNALAAMLRLARAQAIARHTRCMIEIVAINDDSAGRPMPPGTPYSRSLDGPGDSVRIIPYRACRDALTGTNCYLLQPGAIREYVLPSGVIFDDQESGRSYPANASVRCDYDEDGVADPVRAEKVFFDALPDGSIEGVGGVQPGGYVLTIKDCNSGARATIAIVPGTGFIAIR